VAYFYSLHVYRKCVLTVHQPTSQQDAHNEVVSFGCETRSLTLREICRLKVFENRVLRRIFGPKRDEVTGEWRKLRNEELNDLYLLCFFAATPPPQIGPGPPHSQDF